MDWRKEDITDPEKTCTGSSRPFINYRDVSVFHIGSVLQGTHSTTLKEMIVQTFPRGIFNTCAGYSVYKGQPHCGMK